MAIGIDIDEVLFPLVFEECKFLSKKYGIKITQEDFHDYDFWKNPAYKINGIQATKEQAIHDFYEFATTSEFRKIKPIPGSQEAVFQLTKLDKIIAVTSRPHEFVNHTKWQLGYFFPRAFSDAVFGNHYAKNSRANITKRQLCEENNIGLLFEDNISYALDVSSDIPVILFNRPWNQDKDDTSGRIIRVYSWREALEEARKIYSRR